MADNTSSIQECRKFECMIHELAEQMRQLAESNAAHMRQLVESIVAELPEIKQTIAIKVYNLHAGEESSHLSGESLSYTYRRRETGKGHNSYATPTRQTRVNFPCFAGEELRGWLYKCENFGTPWDMKVKVAAVHLEGRALQWHQMYMQKIVTMDTPHWEEYVQALHFRFRTTVFEDPMVELMTLRQTGDLEERLETFDSLLGRVCLLEEYAISCLLAAIKAEIANVVRMHRPKTLLEAYALARQQTITFKHSRGRNYYYGGATTRIIGAPQKTVPYTSGVAKLYAMSGILPRQPTTPYKNEGRPANPLRRLTSAKMDEKR